ncbi:hypothetical protein P2318_01380 [Myxococcaceae bacterium GXIMD 01537]
MSDAFENDPIPPALQALLELFHQELAQVKFPDVDGAVLREAAARVRERAEEVARAQAALEAARQALQETQEALLQKGQRALAYARVFAEDDAELSTKLDAVSLPRLARKAVRVEGAAVAESAMASDENAPKRRGRPPKARPAGGASLFSEAGGPEALAAAHVNGAANGVLPTA